MTFQEILDNILTRAKEEAQNFQEAQRMLYINDEYIYLKQKIDLLNGVEWTADDADTNYTDTTLTAGIKVIPNAKDGIVKKVEIKKNDKWATLTYTNNIIGGLETTTEPTEYLVRDGNIELLGVYAVDVTVRVFVTNDIVLLTDANKANSPRLPLIGQKMLELASVIAFEKHYGRSTVDMELKYEKLDSQLTKSVRSKTVIQTFKAKSNQRK